MSKAAGGTRKRSSRGSAESLRRSVKDGERHPYYILHGAEGFERDATCSWLAQRVGPETAADFNLDIFHGDSLDPRRVVDVYQSYPVMASQRLLILKSCEKLAADKCRSLEEIVKVPAETSVVIAVGEKIDLRRSLWRGMSQVGCSVEFKPPYDNQLPAWISRYARRQGIELEADAIELLRVYVGSNLRELASEIEKLKVYKSHPEGRAESTGPISRRVVEELVGLSRQSSIFALTDAVGQGDRNRAVELTHALLGRGEEPIRIVAMLNRHLQLLLRAKSLESEHPSRAEMAKHLGVAPFFLQAYLDQANVSSSKALWDKLSAALAADASIKSRGRSQQRLILDICLSDLASAGKPREGEDGREPN